MNVSSSVDDQRLDITHTLAPVARSIGLARVARAALIGFVCGAVVGVCVLLAGHLHPFDFSIPVAILAWVAGTLAGAAVGVACWPRALEAARAADLYFGLDDRLTTALELRSSNTPVAHLQNRDVARRIQGLRLGRSRERSFRRNEGVAALLAVVAFAGALALGSPAKTHTVQTATGTHTNSQRARQNAAKQVQKLQAQLHLGLTPLQQQNPAMRKLDLALAKLRRQLLKASTPRASLRAISLTQQQLRRLALGLHPINSKAVAQLDGSLGKYLGKGQAGNKQPAASKSSLAAAQALNRLAQSLSHLTPAQQSALARALARAANASSNNTLRSLLRQAASALANGDPRSASAALQRAANALAQSAGTQAAQSRANAASSQLDAMKSGMVGTSAQIPSGPSASQLAQANGQGKGQSQTIGARRGQTPGSGTAPGRGQGSRLGNGFRPGQGKGTGQGRGIGTGRGTGRAQGRGVRAGAATGRGNGRGQGRGANNGQAVTNRQGQGTSGARGRGGRGRANRSRVGRNVMVYIPGKQGKGAEIVRNGPNGAPEPGALVPYQQVFAQYTQSAHQALDRSALPPSVQGYVRRYFSSISQ